MANNTVSVLARLKNKSKEEGIPLQQLLNLLCQEEFIRRLSESTYRENLILKGGYLLYSISGFTSRPTIDFSVLIGIIIDFTSLPYQAIIGENEFFGNWNCRERKYN